MTSDERLERLTERHEALTMNLGLESREIRELRKLVEIDAENIRAVARIATIHDRRITHLEDGAS